MSDSWPAAYSIECMEHDGSVDARRALAAAPAERESQVTSPRPAARRPRGRAAPPHTQVEVPGARPPRRGAVFKFLIIAIGIALQSSQ